MNNNRILIIGSVAIDSIATPFGKREAILGGSATFSSISASFFNSDVSIVAVVGKDFPKKYINVLDKKGINLDGLEVADGKTFRWKGDYSCDLNSPKTIYTHLNVFQTFKPFVPYEHRESGYVFLANIDPDLQDDVLSQLKGPRTVFCDTMNFWILSKPAALKKLLKKVDVFLLNDGEARLLSGETNLINAAKYIMTLGVKSVIIKKGEHGVLYFSKHARFAAPAFLLENIYDPTGAGDTFAGGMVGYLSKTGKIDDSTVKKSLIYGSIMASFAVEDFSVNRLLKLKKQEVEKRYKEFVGITRF